MKSTITILKRAVNYSSFYSNSEDWHVAFYNSEKGIELNVSTYFGDSDISLKVIDPEKINMLEKIHDDGWRRKIERKSTTETYNGRTFVYAEDFKEIVDLVSRIRLEKYLLQTLIFQGELLYTVKTIKHNIFLSNLYEELKKTEDK